MSDTEKEIQGTTYYMRLMPPKEGSRLFVRYLKLISRIDGNASAEEKGKQLLMAFDESDVTVFSEAFAKCTEVQIGETGDDRRLPLSKIFDVHFAGAYLKMMQWIIMGFEVNFVNLPNG